MTGPRHDLVFVPLGGTGEIGMNLNLYGYRDQWLMVDLGIAFADSYLPGVDVIMPDPAFIVDRRDKLLGLILTHAHEDHAGAVVHIWPQLRCPIYATPFTAAILRGKLLEAGLIDEVTLHEVPLEGRVELGPFACDFVSLTHSIPEPNALLIHTPVGRVFHTGDWKLDPDPLVGLPTDEGRLRAIGDEGVLAMVCDSTNVLNLKGSGSEAAVKESLSQVVAAQPGRVFVTTFASNIARVGSVGAAAAANDRQLCLVGRSIQRNVDVARSLGYLKDLPPVVSEDAAGYLPPDKVLYVCTGCQGEGRAALARIVAGQHRQVVIESGDLVVFSSKIIPGNELAIARLVNALASEGVEVITEREAFVHVSGHPGREELAQMYEWIRPTIAIPVHGEPRHLLAHGRFASSLGVEQVVSAENGTVVRLGPGPTAIVDRVDVGRLALDGGTLVAVDGDEIVSRRRIMLNGYLGVAVAVDAAGALVASPSVDMQGLPANDHGDLESAIQDAVAAACAKVGAREGRDDGRLAEALRIAARKAARHATGKAPGPITRIHVLRV